VILKNKLRVAKKLLTIYGEITFTRTMLAPVNRSNAAALSRLCGAKNVYPLDEFLGIDGLPFKITVKMMASIAREAVRASSYQRAAEVIRDHYGVPISVTNVRLVTDYVGSVVYSDDTRKAEAAKASLDKPIDRRKKRRRPDDILYLEMDGAMVNTRIQTEDSSWKECKIAIAFHSRDLYTWVTGKNETRRQITRKRLIGYIGDYQTFKYYLLAIAREYEYQYCSKVVVISDGAKWIQTIVRELFPDAIHILDLSHVKEKIGKFGSQFFHKKKDADMWITVINNLIEAGRIDEALAYMEPIKGETFTDGLQNPHTYIENHKSCMDYGAYREAGYFVGSGAAESANKYTMQNRMKLQGMRWNRETGQGMLSLKARLESGRWFEVEPLLRQRCGLSHTPQE
jgi:hypothetical protein